MGPARRDVGFILALNASGWGIFVLYVMPHHFDYQGEGGSRGLGVGLGVAITAWFLGFRHAFDADHISCIDNTTRKLMADGKRPLGTGFFFSFGHSTVIMAVGVGHHDRGPGGVRRHGRPELGLRDRRRGDRDARWRPASCT